jgi:NADPH-ferrihemoprotein reductase
MEDIKSKEEGSLSNVHFAVYGLGDSSYAHYNKSAKEIQEELIRCGAQEVKEMGLGDDHDEDK